MKVTLKALCLSILVFAFAANIQAKDQEPSSGVLATTYATSDMITLQPTAEYDAYQLITSGPEGIRFEQEFNGMHVPFIEAYDRNGNLLPDGQYFYELRAIVKVDAQTRAAMEAVRDNREALATMRAQGLIPDRAPAQSGSFRVENGYIVLPETEVAAAIRTKGEDGRDNSKPGRPTGGNDAGGTVDAGASDIDDSRAQVIATDLIVDGSACVGVDCTSGESFGFDTLRLKENNLRIKFDDTSGSGSFPNNDWQLTANESGNGGANKFSIDDITNGKTPMTLIANAPSNSLYINNGGNVGFGNSNPAVNLHVTEGNSPTLRLEQDGSSGFTAQTWDIAGNETNFFVRDVTHGSKLPFKIKPSAPTDSLFIAASGNIGLGDTTPEAKLDIENGWMKITDNTERNVASGEASLLIEQTSPATDNHVLMKLVAEGSANMLFSDNADGVTWKMVMNGGGGTSSNFQISRDGSGVNEFNLDHNGNLTVTGSVTGLSDRNMKENFSEVDPNEVLTRVLSLPVTTWNYIDDGSEVRHIGPMAQDFHAAFGMGASNTGIGFGDTAGVAFSAIQGLNNIIQEKDQRIKSLENKLAQQEARLQALEAALLK